MEDSGTSVLLVGGCARKSSPLARHLLKRGCNLSFAAYKKEATGLSSSAVVLSEFDLRDGTAYELMAPFLGTDTPMFFSYAVENSCWWITAMFQGRDCYGEPGRRPREFTILLDELLSEKRSTRVPHGANGNRQSFCESAVQTDPRARASSKEKYHAENKS